MKALAESCSLQRRASAEPLQDSDIEGPRRLTERTRRSWEARRKEATFRQHLQDIIDAARRKRHDDARE